VNAVGFVAGEVADEVISIVAGGLSTKIERRDYGAPVVNNIL
jgi:hypothetical protein